LRWIKNQSGFAEPQASQALPLLDGFEIVDDCANLVGLEDEFTPPYQRKRLRRLAKPFA